MPFIAVHPTEEPIQMTQPHEHDTLLSDESNDWKLVVVPTDHEFLTVSDELLSTGYYDKVNNYPGAPTIRAWPQEEIDTYEAAIADAEAAALEANPE